MNEAVREARRLEHPCTLTSALSMTCRIRRVVGLSEDVQRHAEEVISLSNEYGFPHRLGEGYIHRGGFIGHDQSSARRPYFAIEGGFDVARHRNCYNRRVRAYNAR